MIALVLTAALVGAAIGHFGFQPDYTLDTAIGGTVDMKDAPDDGLNDGLHIASFAMEHMSPKATPDEADPQPKYVVTKQDGLIVVRYPDHQGGGIHTITNTHTTALPQEEQDRLAGGIHVYTQDALFRVLEDYGS